MDKELLENDSNITKEAPEKTETDMQETEAAEVPEINESEADGTETAGDEPEEDTDGTEEAAEDDTCRESAESDDCRENDDTDTAEEGGEDSNSEYCDGSEGSENDEENLPYCTMCELNHVYEGHEFCEVCESKLKKTRLPFIGTLITLTVLVASLFAFVLTVLLSSPVLQVIKAEKYAKQHCWYSAFMTYMDMDSIIDEVTASMGNSGEDVKLLISYGDNFKIDRFISYSKAFSPIEAIQNAQYLFDTDDSGFTDKNKDYQKVNDIYQKYEQTYYAIEDILMSLQTGEVPETKKIAADLEALRGQDGVDDVFLDYFIYSACGYYGKNNDDELLDCLDTLDKRAKESGIDYSWLYYGDIARILIDNKRFDEAEPYLQTLTDNDKSNQESREMMMTVLVSKGDFDGAEDIIEAFENDNGGESDSSAIMRVKLARYKGDYEYAKELANEAMETYTMVAEFNRQLALIALIEGDYNEAFYNASTAYNLVMYLYQYGQDTSQFTSQLSNTIYVATMLCKKQNTIDKEYKEDLETLYEMIKEEDMGQDIKDIVSGKTDVKDVLTKGVYDFT